MNKTAIKNFAIWARNKLIADISYRAGLMGITADGIHAALPQSTGQTEFYDIGTAEPYAITGEAIRQRRHLAELIQRKEKDTDYKTAYKYIIEEVAYTWFNRLIAVRFMEVNDYLPSHIRVLSSDTGKLEPDLVTTPFDAELEFTNAEQQTIIDLKNANKLDEVFRMLFIKQCNALNEILPALFEKTNDYSELLLNLSVIDQDGVVYHLVHDIPEEDFDVERGGQVEIIGWLYQYYNTEPKDQVFSNLKNNIKVSKENIPAATQLFTPDWIVRYMVENSLGRLWLEGHPNDSLKMGWHYYLDEAEQVIEAKLQLEKIQIKNAQLNPEDILVIDPCQGSGHILAYVFDLLVQIYETNGYSAREAAISIVKNNIWGLDIDTRATQLAYFSIMMKARQYDRRFFSRGIQPHVFAVMESNNLDLHCIEYFVNEREILRSAMDTLIGELYDASDYGSILNVTQVNFDALYARFDEIKNETNPTIYSYQTVETLLPFVKAAQAMAQKYHVVITNPPYMGSSNVNKKLLKYLDKNYADFRSDLSTVFMERARTFCKANGFYALINIPVWMFISRFEKMREGFSANSTYINMLHLGRGVFGSDFGTVAFCLRKDHIKNYIGTYLRLFNEQGSVSTNEEKQAWFYEQNRRYYINQDLFGNIKGAPIAYSLSETVFDTFNNPTVECISESKAGVATSDNDTYLRLWYEVDYTRTYLNAFNTEDFHNSGKRYAVYNKGGQFRRWYGNLDYLIKFDQPSYSNLLCIGNKLPSRNYYFKKAITWSDISMRGVAFRFEPQGSVFDGSADVVFTDDKYFLYLLGLLNTNYVSELATILNPTIHFKLGDYRKLPFIYDEKEASHIVEIVEECVDISKEDWDEQETSWDFQRHPLAVSTSSSLSIAYQHRADYVNQRFVRLKDNEELLNSIFNKIYNIEGSISNIVNEKDVTIKTENLSEEIKGLLSYAVGCLFGRYSLDMSGLVYAGGAWDASLYTTFSPDIDNVIPITDEEYLEDDIVNRLCVWLKAVYGESTLEENLDFMATALNGKGSSSREIIRNYFLDDFFKDHCQTYSAAGSGKRPIYWLFDSGKQNGFKALIYLHRYNADTIGNLRIDYLHRMQRVYESEITRMQDMIDHSTNAREVGQATKRRDKLTKQLKECREYDEKLAHLALSRIELDLDDGVKVNYRKLQTANDGKFYEVLADSKNIMAKK